MLELGRPTGGDENVNGLSEAIPAQPPGEIKREPSAQAVPIESEREIQIRVQCLGKRGQQGIEPRKSRSPKPFFTARQVDTSHFDTRRKQASPVTKCRSPSAGMRETKEAGKCATYSARPQGTTPFCHTFATSARTKLPLKTPESELSPGQPR